MRPKHQGRNRRDCMKQFKAAWDRFVADEASLTDLRVDQDETNPVGRLAILWKLWAPQMDAYVQRAIEPMAAPRYGVPGDE